MKKRNLRIISSGFSAGAVIGMLLFLVNTPPDSVFLQTLKILLVAVICSLVSGAAITGVLFLVELFRAKAYAPYRQKLAEEGAILLEDSARRIFRGKAAKGRLFLTQKSLSFYSSESEAFSISISDITGIQISDAKKGEITLFLPQDGSAVFLVSDALAWFDAVGELQKV